MTEPDSSPLDAVRPLVVIAVFFVIVPAALLFIENPASAQFFITAGTLVIGVLLIAIPLVFIALIARSRR
ncbi:MAG: hypothetical protein ACR2P2_19295 [Nakamurella sp.]